MKPTRRRACEIETASAKWGKTKGTSVSAKTASEPPSTQAAHRLRAANSANGTQSRAATATAPLRVKSRSATW